MKISLSQSDLNNALSVVSRFVSNRSQMPVLGNILFSADQKSLVLYSSNLDISCSYSLDANITTPGSITIPSRELSEYISYLPAGNIDIDSNENFISTLTSSSSKSTFAGQSPDDFPIPSTFVPSVSFSLNFTDFQKTIQKISFSAASDDSRPVLASVLWNLTSSNFTLVATDGFRLSLKSSPLSQPISLDGDENISLMLPIKTILELSRLSKADDNLVVSVSKDHKHISFTLGQITLTSALLSGDYPDYQRIIPQSSSLKLSLDYKDLSQAIRLSSVFARSSANIVKFHITSSLIHLSSSTPQVGDNSIDLAATVSGEPIDIAFNYKFVSDFLSVCASSEITIELNQSLTPAVFRDPSDPDFLHIIMPVRLQD